MAGAPRLGARAQVTVVRAPEKNVMFALPTCPLHPTPRAQSLASAENTLSICSGVPMEMRMQSDSPGDV